MTLLAVMMLRSGSPTVSLPLSTTRTSLPGFVMSITLPRSVVSTQCAAVKTWRGVIIVPEQM